MSTQLTHIRQLSVGVCVYQQAPDLALDGVVAPLSDPAPNQASAIVEEVLRRPRVVAERAPDGEVVVDGDGIRQFVVADSAVDVAGVLAELKLGRVHADDDQPRRARTRDSRPSRTGTCESS
jgi:hypothetical protein